jgi:xanthosine utilization system XapX-like protein
VITFRPSASTALICFILGNVLAMVSMGLPVLPKVMLIGVSGVFMGYGLREAVLMLKARSQQAS